MSVAIAVICLFLERGKVQGWIQKGYLPTVETPIRSGSGMVSLVPADALDTFERPKAGYPKGRPRKDAGDDGPTGETTT